MMGADKEIGRGWGGLYRVALAHAHESSKGPNLQARAERLIHMQRVQLRPPEVFRILEDEVTILPGRGRRRTPQLMTRRLDWCASLPSPAPNDPPQKSKGHTYRFDRFVMI